MKKKIIIAASLVLAIAVAVFGLFIYSISPTVGKSQTGA